MKRAPFVLVKNQIRQNKEPYHVKIHLNRLTCDEINRAQPNDKMEIKCLDKAHIQTFFKQRDSKGNKGVNGHAILLAGNVGKMGAAVIAAKACLRAGIGLLTVNIPKEERFIMQTALPEAMLNWRNDIEGDKLELENFNCIGMGPGFGLDVQSFKILTKLIGSSTIPMVIDADAITFLSQNFDVVKLLKPKTIITPHVKEFDRLFGIHKNEEERRNAVIKYAKKYQIIIVLKDYQTLISDGTQHYLYTQGNAGLAKGGSGDALFGIICALVGQGYPAMEAAKLAVFLHGTAAHYAIKTQSLESMLISDVIDQLGFAFKEIAE